MQKDRMNKGNEWHKYVESGFDERYKGGKAIAKKKLSTTRGAIDRVILTNNRQRRGIMIQEVS